MIRIRKYMFGLIAALSVLGFTACQDDFDAFQIDAPVATMERTISILDLKTQFWDDATNYADSIYDSEDPDHRFIVSGRVISSDEQGNVFKSLVIQDETAALALSINSYNLYLNYRVGQEIVIDLTGMHIGKYNGYQQIGRPEWYANGNAWEVTFMSPEYFQQHIELNGWPEPEKIDTLVVPNFSRITATPEILRQYQGQLVRFTNVYFEDAGKELFSEYHSSGVNRNIVDQSGLTLTVRTSGYCTFWNNTLPEGNLDVVGILSYYGTTGWQLLLIDEDGCIQVGERPGAKDNPYTVAGAIDSQKDGLTANGWVKGYIVGAVAPEVEIVSSNDDIEWTAPTVLANTLVIADSPEVNNYEECLVINLPSESVFRTVGNLRDNPDNLGREILVKGTFAEFLGTYGITENTGTASEFEIKGVEVDDDDDEIATGDGSKEKPYNLTQIMAYNASSTTEAAATGVWAKGYIVGSIPTGSTYISYTNFSTTDAPTTNIVIGPTADCTDYSLCVPVALPSGSTARTELNLADNPTNLGKAVTLYGDVYKYFGVTGLKNISEYILGDGGSTDSGTTTTETIYESLLPESSEMPDGWTIQTIESGGLENVWAWKVYNSAGYLNGSGYSGGALATEAYAISPEIDLTDYSQASFSFDHTAKFQTTLKSLCGVVVRVGSTGAWQSLSIPTWPEAGSWTFVNSGAIDLSDYAGKTIQIAFKYKSSTDGADTWEIKNFVVTSAAGTNGGDNNGSDNNGSDNNGNDNNGNDDDDGNGATPSTEGVTVAATSISNVPGTTTIGDYTFVIDKNSGTTTPISHANTSAIRLYAKNSIAISGKQMAKIVFTLSSDAKYRYTTVTPSTGKISPAQALGDTSFTWIGDASEVTFTVGDYATLGTDGETSPGQIRFTSIEIYPAI